MNSRFNRIKKPILFSLLAALALLGMGCKQRDGSSGGDPINELKTDSVSTVRVYRLNGESVHEFAGDAFKPIRGVDCVFETRDASKIKEILEMFSNWSAKDNVREAIDTAGKIFVCFDDKISIEYIGAVDIANCKHYGRVHMNGEVISCELPEAFGRFIAEL